MRKILVPVLCVFLAGCAISNTADYHHGKAILPEKFTGNSKLLVLVKDIRSYIASGDKASSFVGLQRSFYGIPYSVHTRSGKSLADDLSGLIARSIEGSVSEVKNKPLTLNDNVKMVINTNTHAGWKTLLVTLREWKTDITAVGTGSFYYDVTLVVLDSSGGQLAMKSAKGKGLVNRNHSFNVNINEIMDKLLNDPNIVLAVNSGKTLPTQSTVEIKSSPVTMESKPLTSSPSSKAKQDCTVDQVLGMKKTGMTEAQMKAACN
ncbi:MAG: hypothetical protein V3U84_10060 [Thiotrichaceae bacterium]